MSAIAVHVRTERIAAVARAFLAMLVLSALVVAWGWLRDQDLRNLATLPSETRQALYERTLANLVSVCTGPNARRYESFCREQAAVALHLPECDARCERAARPVLAYPTR